MDRHPSTPKTISEALQDYITTGIQAGTSFVQRKILRASTSSYEQRQRHALSSQRWSAGRDRTLSRPSREGREKGSDPLSQGTHTAGRYRTLEQRIAARMLPSARRWAAAIYSPIKGDRARRRALR
jgi:hypothetical protein